MTIYRAPKDGTPRRDKCKHDIGDEGDLNRENWTGPIRPILIIRPKSTPIVLPSACRLYLPKLYELC